ncbi:tetratricopeptide repeat protein [Mucilaginibacter myungsuensis]|uniref:SH3b domain-containing protein n=1 Tax=Mucilaginibacter myungsuensis TaxID=649104 RepID=A0A929KYH0_9SPHI|nr:hypothetical protein [Mucilaginibacter myungsuensis]MBE9662860.1 hypothetical protein [Mucilaginibacter myungsuensis]MDN3598280.1 hypothetical protein [Mucilaginibacter myungsuensis]
MKFKRILYLFLCLALPLLSFGSSTADGDALYAKAKYTEAKTAYQKLINDGYASASLYYNMGNASFKTGDIPTAIWYYEKAHKLSPADEDIAFNIRFANQRTADRIEARPELFLYRWWRGFVLSISLSALSILSVASILLASASLIYYLFTNSVTLKKTSFYSAIGLFVIGLVFIFMGNRQSAYFDAHKQAIIFSATSTVKSTPSELSKTLFLLHAGTKVNLLDAKGKKIKVGLANGTTGWIAAGDVKEI